MGRWCGVRKGCHCGRACCAFAVLITALHCVLFIGARVRNLPGVGEEYDIVEAALPESQHGQAVQADATRRPNQESTSELGAQLPQQGRATVRRFPRVTTGTAAPSSTGAATTAPATTPSIDVVVPTEKANPVSVIHMFSKELNFPFKHCALIGSSSMMLGLGLGDRIDSHDTVIRVNRLPNTSYEPDFGSRTDVLFVNRFTLRAEMSVDILGGGSISCTENPRRCKKAFAAMIFKGSGPSRPWGKYTRYMRAFPFPIGHQLNENARVATRMPVFRIGKGHVTSGFMGFIAFTPICETMTLYGFGGGNSADGHSERRHYLRGEHELLRRAATGNMQPSDMHSPDEEFHNDSAWVYGHLQRMRDKITILDLTELRQKRGLPEDVNVGPRGAFNMKLFERKT
mmetsp:Transcript_7791/g.18125  ORF Transcript_7791/g.18125 Transcript_7791/m.18125 type:complete len:400 (-) Transcript_7791:14-1213(-)